MKLTALHKQLLQTPGVSGHEAQVRAILKREYESLGFETIQDNLGSIFAVKKSKQADAPRVMFVSHMDEVGFIVKSITAHGMLKLSMVGGIWEQCMMAQRLVLTARDGKEFKGAMIATSKHILSADELSKPVQLGKMAADFGFTSKEDAHKHGIYPGCQVTFDADVVEMLNGRVLARAIDDRMGCIIGLEVLRELKDVELPYDLYIGASVQEEIGTRGASTVTQMIKPNFALVCDVSAALDQEGKVEMGSIGAGTMVRIMDTGQIQLPHLVSYQEELAKKNDITTQYYFSMGGTDARIIHTSLEGVPTIQTAMVARSIHNSCSVMDMFDVEQTKKMAIAILKDFSEKRLTEWKNV